MSTPGAGIPIGVYRGRGCGSPQSASTRTSSAVKCRRLLTSWPKQPTSWAQFENGNLTSAADVSVWQNALGHRQLALGVPACCGASAGSGGTTWAEEASGVNDTHWEALGHRLIGLGLGGALSRIGREFNGNWYPWQVAEGGQASYIAGYSHVVTVLRGLPGAAFRFCWNPSLGAGNLTARAPRAAIPVTAMSMRSASMSMTGRRRTAPGSRSIPGTPRTRPPRSSRKCSTSC